MPIMHKFFFYCSVRLGAIIGGTTSAAITFLIILWAMGIDSFEEVIRSIRSYVNEYQQEEYLDSILRYIENDAKTTLRILLVHFSIYLLVCCLEVLGAFQLKRLLLLPYIIEQLLLLMLFFAVHVIGMMLLRKKVNLGVLIGVTVAGGFGLLFLFYVWSCVVALYQIINIVNSDSYQYSYGADPLKPQQRLSTPSHPNNNQYSYNRNVIEHVKIYKTPDFARNTNMKKAANVQYIDLNNQTKFVQTPNGNATQNEDDVESYNMLHKDFSNLQEKLQKFTYNNYYKVY